MRREMQWYEKVKLEEEERAREGSSICIFQGGECAFTVNHSYIIICLPTFQFIGQQLCKVFDTCFPLASYLSYWSFVYVGGLS